MATIRCKVTKRHDSYNVDDVIEVDEKHLQRLTRRGRVKRIDNRRVERSRITGIPPDFVRNTKATPRMVFVDEDDPTVVDFRGVEKEDAPVEIPSVGPDDDREERAPASMPVGPDLRRPVRERETKATVRDVEIRKVNQFWHHVYVDGEPILNAKKRPRNFRKAEAEAAAKRLRRDKDI